METERMRAAVEPLVRCRIEQGLELLFRQAEPEAVAKLTALVLLLTQWAPRMNLTGHRDPLEITNRLVLDAAALAAAIPELEAATDLADLGSGAGFPGLPIAILHPALTVHLVEARQKRHHFQREARRQLGLEQVVPVLGRSDAVAVHPSSVVVAQAMTEPTAALAAMRPWARPGGLLILPASDAAERPELPGRDGDFDGPLERRTYHVPMSDVHRQIWLVRIRNRTGLC